MVATHPILPGLSITDGSFLYNQGSYRLVLTGFFS